jgi:UDP-N-acetylbacillosamine N-acetyltransferase
MDIIIVGGFVEIIELCENCGLNILGLIDNSNQRFLNGYPILGNDSDADSLFENYSNIPLVITPDIPKIREKLVVFYKSKGFSFKSVISPKAEISKSSIIGEGVIIQAGVNVSSNVKIGDFVKLNTNSNIMHDSEIGPFTTIAPNAVILGRVLVSSNCYIGANATILPELAVQSNVLIGAGAVVVNNIEKGKIVKGVPAK